ncbi:ABC transporter ATP-binding protein [Phycicoccus endophyticus]|uniref:ABC transporter ATP-binding protein n=1 Tax=Phycicoccus endophyticus TaxID=1690220 RepID=UPI001408D000|nr:ABC transporter ATP-binding protein [Phycicoccus endophyticus]NHI19712.1 ABC transporter ATP-binding protein [Phycicoccus endophyticus]GGL33639.1 ABC transporter [Phycicoccus endophyticus]
MATTEPTTTAPEAAATDVALDVRGLQKTYGGQGRSVEAIRELSFSVPRGQLTCIVGPSGAGKTTLLRCIAGLLDVTAGEIVLDGERVTGPPRGMAVVFQEYGRSLFPWMTVQQNVERPLIERRVPKAERRRVVADALAAVGLGDSGEAHPWQLSGGMQQRVAIARAVAYEPTVLIMDEPFAAVDAQTRADLEDLVRDLWHRLGVTVLFVTHDIDESVYLGQRVLVLSNRPTVLLEDVTVDLPDERDQLGTRGTHRFAELRGHVYELIQRAKAGHRPEDDAGPAS